MYSYFGNNGHYDILLIMMKCNFIMYFDSLGVNYGYPCAEEEHHRDSKKGDKIKPQWLGPYKIKWHLDKGVYQLKCLKGVGSR